MKRIVRLSLTFQTEITMTASSFLLSVFTHFFSAATTTVAVGRDQVIQIANEILSIRTWYSILPLLMHTLKIEVFFVIFSFSPSFHSFFHQMPKAQKPMLIELAATVSANY